MTKEQLQPLHDKIYKLIEGKLVDDDEEFAIGPDEIETGAEHNMYLVEDAIDQVVQEVRDELKAAWLTFP